MHPPVKLYMCGRPVCSGNVQQTKLICTRVLSRRCVISQSPRQAVVQKRRTRQVSEGNMVKLASVRESRMYGPPGVRDVAEDVNAFAYIVATVLLLAGTILLFPGKNHKVGLILLLISLVIIVLVNLHDLYAQLAGFDFRLPLVTYDPQLALIEVASPLVQAIGGIVFFIGILLLLRSAQGKYDYETRRTVEEHAYRLLTAGPALWLLGSIHNAFQVYEKTNTQVQAWQKAVSIPFVIASTLLLVSGILNVLWWPRTALRKITKTSVWLATVACALLVVAAILNAIRIFQLQQVDREGGPLEKLRGGAQEQLEQERRHREPFLGAKGKTQADIESEGRGSQGPVESRTAVHSTYA